MAGREPLAHRLARARALIARMYLDAPHLADPGRGPVSGRALGALADGAWDEAELAALRDTIQRFGVPEQPFQDLVSGMEMDVAGHRYATFADLELYCYRVAGMVGLLLCPVLGTSDVRAAGAAADLGRAMQLTNILRDVREDLARGRVYLPEDELAAFGLSREDLARGVVDDRWRAFMRCQIRPGARVLRAGRSRGAVAHRLRHPADGEADGRHLRRHPRRHRGAGARRLLRPGARPVQRQAGLRRRDAPPPADGAARSAGRPPGPAPPEAGIMSRPAQIAVVGGGIGGLVAAGLLARAGRR